MNQAILNRNHVVGLLEGCGFVRASTYNDHRLLEALKSVAAGSVEKEDLNSLSALHLYLYTRVCGHIEHGDEILFTGEVDAVRHNGKKSKPRQPAKKRDAFGSIIGSENAKANALLCGEPLTAAQIQHMIDSKQPLTTHLDRLVRLGICKWKKGQGYYLNEDR